MATVANEMWYNIFGHIAAAADLQYSKYDQNYKVAQKTLASLCLVSKKFAAIGQPLLHRSFAKPASTLSETTPSDRFESRRGWRRLSHRSGGRRGLFAEMQLPLRENTSLENFLRTIIQRPDLALSVKNLYIERFNDAALMMFPVAPIDESLATTLVHGSDTFVGLDKFDQEFVDAWRRHLKQGVESAEIALLLTLVPSLRSLHLCCSKNDLGRYIQETCDLMIAPLPCRILPVLSSLGLETRYTSAGQISLNRCISLITLPTLESISGTGFRGRHGAQVNQDIFSRLSRNQVLHLDFQECLDAPLYLPDFIRSCTKLETLTVETSRVNNDNLFNDNNFLEAIKVRAGTLKSLTLLMMKDRCESQIWDLRTLTNLQYLEIDMNILLRNAGSTLITNCLPANIETLHIHRNNHEIIPQIECLLASRSLFPNLKLLEVGVSKERSMTHVEIAGKWAEMNYTKESIDGSSILLTFWDGQNGFMNNLNLLRSVTHSSVVAKMVAREPGVLVAEVYFEDDWYSGYIY